MDTFTVRNLTFFYPNKEKPTLDNISLSVKKGDFLVLCGPSGCGKSTFLRQLKSSLAPYGHIKGEILFEGEKLNDINHKDQSSKIGFVLQSPENQIVTDKVWHELAFGLESLGLDNHTIRRRTAEMASFFGIQTWFHKDVSELSGGQKQLLNLASIMAMQPRVLILDEPTSQLDPIAASEFISTLGKINRELGTTIILTEHRLEEAFAQANRAVVLKEGKIICDDKSHNVGIKLKELEDTMFLAMPTAMRIWAAVENKLECPITVREGKKWLENYSKEHKLIDIKREDDYISQEETVIFAKDVWFKYEQDSPDIVKGLNLQVKKGEFLALLGGNGTGKTTTLKLISGIKKQYRGEISVIGKVGVLPQNPQTLFMKKTVREDLFQVYEGKNIPKEIQKENVEKIVTLCNLAKLLDSHPYDISGGEQQRVALGKVLLNSPDILLLDEPTKGFDAEFKEIFAEIINMLLLQNVTVFMISHDIEFCALYAHRCALFFDGNIVAEDRPREFFSGNSFYTTSANRMARDFIKDPITAEDVILACGSKIYKKKKLPTKIHELPKPKENSKDYKPKKLPWYRKFIALISLITAIGISIYSISVTNLTSLINENGITDLTKDHLKIHMIFFLSLFILMISIGRKSEKEIEPFQVLKDDRKLPKRTVAAAIMILLLIPLTLFVGVNYLGQRKYYFIGLMILLESMVPFFLIFEGRKPKARELVVIATMCALAIAGRAVFFMLPQFKPVTALTIISGVALGAETGFLVGSMSMLCSNIIFSQGPWTPWQMFSMGIIGFLAGILYKKGFLRRSTLSLCIFGVITTIIIYGGIMNFSSALNYSSEINLKMLIPYYIAGIPMDIIHGYATFVFLWFGAEPMLEKLERIKDKYGLVK